jgi:hypothetical protein
VSAFSLGLSILFSITGMFVPAFLNAIDFVFDPILLSPILMLPSHIMVATFAFIFYIVRHRLRAFLSLVHFAHSSGNQFAHSSVNSVAIHDIPTMLKSLSCQDAMLCEWKSIAQHGNTDDCAIWMRMQLHRLWMTQIRQANAMVGHNRMWLGFQSLVLLIQLIVFGASKFVFRASVTSTVAYLQTLLDIYSIQSVLRAFSAAM